jgi:hypothetical protein
MISVSASRAVMGTENLIGFANHNAPTSSRKNSHHQAENARTVVVRLPFHTQDAHLRVNRRVSSRIFIGVGRFHW